MKTLKQTVLMVTLFAGLSAAATEASDYRAIKAAAHTYMGALTIIADASVKEVSVPDSGQLFKRVLTAIKSQEAKAGMKAGVKLARAKNDSNGIEGAGDIGGGPGMRNMDEK